MHLHEAHIPVADTKISEAFYREVVGLPFAYRDPTRDIVFLWVDEKPKGMIGLWGASTGYGRQNGQGIETRGFGGNVTSELSVIGWMPSAQIYFRDPDGHSLEFITVLPHPPSASFIGFYSEWLMLNQGFFEDLN